MVAAGASAATTTSTAMVEALRSLRLDRIAVLSPHIDALNQRLVAFLAANAIKTVHLQGMGLDGGIEDIDPTQIARHVVETDTAEAQGVYIACTSLRLADVLGSLQERIGKPVISANQVTVWGLLRLAGVETDLMGRSPSERSVA
jgi:maleate isomerase